MPDYSVLYNEVTEDPLSRGYSGMANAAVADSLNAVNRSVSRLATASAVRTYLSTQIDGAGNNQRSSLALLQEFADAGTVRGTAPTVAPAASLNARRSGAQMIVFLLRYAGPDEGFLVTNASIQAQFVGIGPDGGNGPSVLSSAQLAAIAALAQETVSRGAEIGWGPVTEDDVMRVRA